MVGEALPGPELARANGVFKIPNPRIAQSDSYRCIVQPSMSRIFDNIQADLLPALRSTLQVSTRADFCVGYLNLRGWQAIDDLIDGWIPSVGQVCRVLVGMQRPPHEDIRELYRQADERGLIDNATATRAVTPASKLHQA